MHGQMCKKMLWLLELIGKHCCAFLSTNVLLSAKYIKINAGMLAFVLKKMHTCQSRHPFHIYFTTTAIYNLYHSFQKWSIIDPATKIVEVKKQVLSCYKPQHRLSCLFYFLSEGTHKHAPYVITHFRFFTSSPPLRWPSRREVDVLMKKYGGKTGCKRAWNMAFRWNGTQSEEAL